LEYIHIDLWGPSLVVSAGGACYFMLIMDGTSAFWYVEFLREKMGDAVMLIKNFLQKCSMGYTLYPWILLLESTLETSYKPQT